jgi:4-hydroxy-tetrahydrodipicolinate synthase
MHISSRVITVIPTFFNDDTSIDYESIKSHITNQMDRGIETVVILGTTSEAPTLSLEERVQVAEFVFNNFSKNLTIIVGLGGNNTKEMVNELKSIEPYAHLIMISQPSYNKPSQEGIYQHFKILIESTDRQIIIYNVPSRCGVNINPSTVNKIANISKQVVAIKEASGDLSQMMQIKEQCPDLQLYSGDDGIILPVLSIGGIGVISVISNLLPEVVLSVVNEFFNGNIVTAQSNFYNLRPFVKFCFIETNPVPIKYMLSVLTGKDSMANVRLPLVQLTNESKKLYPELEI